MVSSGSGTHKKSALRTRRRATEGARANRKEKGRFEVLPPVMLLAALALMAILRLAAPGPPVTPWPLNLLGLLPVLGGVGLSLRGSRLFHRRGTTVMTFDEPGLLVTDGPFRFSRNPMYLGFVAFLIGCAILMGTASPWLVVVAFSILTDRWYIGVEERAMRLKFGAAYEDYCRITRRWF